MNSAPQVQTTEISDAELDNISGGLSPQAGVTAGTTSLTSSDILAQVDGVKNEVLGTVGGTLAQVSNVGVSASI